MVEEQEEALEGEERPYSEMDKTGTWGRGRVVRWDEDQDFGFLQPDDQGEEIFAHKNDLETHQSI